MKKKSKARNLTWEARSAKTFAVPEVVFVRNEEELVQAIRETNSLEKEPTDGDS